VHLETPTKKLAQTLFLFSACSLAAIVLSIAATTRHHTSAPYSANFPVYTYHNPFHQPAGTSATAVSQANAGGALTKLLSVRWFAGLSGLGALWLGTGYFLYGGHRKRKRIRHNVEYAPETPARMNPLAVIPSRPVLPVAEQGKVSFPVLTVRGKAKTRGCFVHRTTTAPCQSRFRPTTLASSQTRFGRLK
jgi:hypothetical protein